MTEESKVEGTKERSLDEVYELLKKLDDRMTDTQAFNSLMLYRILELLIQNGALDRSEINAEMDLLSKAGLESKLGLSGNYLMEALRIQLLKDGPKNDKTKN